MSLCDGWLLREIGCICFPSRPFCLQRSRGTSRCVGPHHFFPSGATVDAEIHLWSWSLLPLFYERFYTSQDGDRQPRHRTIHPQTSSFCSLTLQSKKSWIWHPKNWVYKNHTSFLLFYQKVSLFLEKGVVIFQMQVCFLHLFLSVPMNLGIGISWWRCVGRLCIFLPLKCVDARDEIGVSLRHFILVFHREVGWSTGIQWMPMLDTVLLGLGHFQGNPDGFSKRKTWDVNEDKWSNYCWWFRNPGQRTSWGW